MSDNLTHSGARKLAESITQFWRDKGVDVTCHIEQIPVGKNVQAAFALRSDLKFKARP
jgi:hypothetical protein